MQPGLRWIGANGDTMVPATDNQGRSHIPEEGMPPGYRLLLWIIILDLLAATTWVWVTAFRFLALLRDGSWVPIIDEFGRMMMGYHVILLITTLAGWAMQIAWRRYGATGLFVPALILGTLSTDMAAIQLTLILLHGAP